MKFSQKLTFKTNIAFQKYEKYIYEDGITF